MQPQSVSFERPIIETSLLVSMLVLNSFSSFLHGVLLDVVIRPQRWLCKNSKLEREVSPMLRSSSIIQYTNKTNAEKAPGMNRSSCVRTGGFFDTVCRVRFRKASKVYMAWLDMKGCSQWIGEFPCRFHNHLASSRRGSVQ
jgi:hypothetical protein